tara:strand:- start:631 stop:1392 length:762 start_codon:yes stop_codon:yes gene_type:complete
MEGNLKSASSVKIGKKFSEKRNALNLSLEQASKILFINIDYLTAIEKGDYSIFPSKSFAKAYFKKYSKYLKIKTKLPDVFNSIQDSKIKFKNVKIGTISSFKNDNYSFFYIAGSIFILFGVLFVIYFFENIDYQETQKVFDSSDKEVIYLTENIIQKKEILLQPNDFNFKDYLDLDFLGECWLEIYVNDELIEAKFFDENDNYRKRINKPFKIVVGNADAVKGAYNGNEIDFIANANRLTRVNIINFDENELD